MLVDAGAKLDKRDYGQSGNDAGGRLAFHRYLPVDYADGLLRIGTQSAIVQPEAAALLRKLMAERGIPTPPEGRTIESVCLAPELCDDLIRARETRRGRLAVDGRGVPEEEQPPAKLARASPDSFTTDFQQRDALRRAMRRYLIAGVVTIGIGGTAASAYAQARSRPRRQPLRRQPQVARAEAGMGPSRSRGHLDDRRHARRADVAPATVRHVAFSPTRNSPRAPGSARRRARSTTRELEPSATRLARLRVHVAGDRSSGRPRPGSHSRGHARPPIRGTSGVGPFNTIDDFSLQDRCITRGVTGSWLRWCARRVRAHHADPGFGHHRP